MMPPPKQTKCPCGKRSTICVHGADEAIWVCRVCYEKLLGLLGRKP